jgi:hypothetical protein
MYLIRSTLLLLLHALYTPFASGGEGGGGFKGSYYANQQIFLRIENMLTQLAPSTPGPSPRCYKNHLGFFFFFLLQLVLPCFLVRVLSPFTCLRAYLHSFADFNCYTISRMAPISLLFALSALVILYCSFGTPSAHALAVADGHIAKRHVAHDSLAKRKNNLSKRCKPRSQSVPSPSSTSPPESSSSSDSPHSSSPLANKPSSSSPPSKPSSSKAAPPAYTPPSGGNARSKNGLAWALGNDPRLPMLASHFS